MSTRSAEMVGAAGKKQAAEAEVMLIRPTLPLPACDITTHITSSVL